MIGFSFLWECCMKLISTLYMNLHIHMGKTTSIKISWFEISCFTCLDIFKKEPVILVIVRFHCMNPHGVKLLNRHFIKETVSLTRYQGARVSIIPNSIQLQLTNRRSMKKPDPKSWNYRLCKAIAAYVDSQDPLKFLHKKGFDAENHDENHQMLILNSPYQKLYWTYITKDGFYIECENWKRLF